MSDIANHTEAVDKALSIIGGCVLSMIVAIANVQNIEEFSLKVFTVAIVGIVGGFSGLLGKKIFQWCEKYFK